ncbi:hypothetical protein XIS1_460153 [Xenorhabdus innexi]|uniref:Uncharacterized protein n=1 Tax=Xenorhabdus innexi TaxID=290109 RepID=A0A1N6MY78_9GAMM|nr:hypothetical protein XIS1_460153 [Xenorhabdus innexi]
MNEVIKKYNYYPINYEIIPLNYHLLEHMILNVLQVASR